MKTILGLLFAIFCFIFVGTGGFMAVELYKMLQANTVTATQSTIMTAFLAAALFFALLTYRASRLAFKGNLRRFWLLINKGWLPI